MKLKPSLTSLLCGIILCTLAAFLWNLAHTDSLTTDEKAHIAAGLTYVTDHSLALNPEHPPLMKLLAGSSILSFTDPILQPLQETTALGVNRQYEHGDLVLNSNITLHDALIFFGRLPFIALTILFGYMIYWYLAKRFGAPTGLLALALFAFSPMIISHGHLVTFDVAAAFGFFGAIIGFAAFLNEPTLKRALGAGVCLALALLIKFSALLLVLIFVVIFIAWVYIKRPLHVSTVIRNGLYALLTSGLIVYACYFMLSIGYAPLQNKADILEMTKHHQGQSLMHFTAELAAHRLTQPVGEYLFGAIQTSARSLGGNASYFMGQVENYGTPRYFPILFLTKESLPTIAIVLLAIVHIVVMRAWKKQPIQWKQLFLANPTESIMAITVGFYWLLALTSTLNIGYRHVLPTIPLIFILSAVALREWITPTSRPGQPWIIGLLVAWVIAEPLIHYPNLLNYYNQIAGGDAGGYEISVDSNYDWGQDLARLGKYVDENQINSIALEYFGGDMPEYYLGDKYIAWYSAKGAPEGWFAVSATFLEGAQAPHSLDLPIKSVDTYSWLRGIKPVTRIGSIFVYHLP